MESNSPPPNSGEGVVSPPVATEISIPIPEHVKQAQQEVEAKYSQVMDEMEKSTKEEGYYFAEFGYKNSGHKNNQDNRALIFIEPVMQETTTGIGPFKKTKQKPTFVVMTRIGPKIIIPADKLQEDLLRNAIENRVSGYIRQSIVLSERSPGEQPTDKEMQDVNMGIADIHTIGKVNWFGQGFYDLIGQSVIEIGNGVSEPQIGIGENMNIIGGTSMTPVDNATFAEAMKKSKEAAKDRHMPQLAEQKQRLSDAEALLGSIKPTQQNQ